MFVLFNFIIYKNCLKNNGVASQGQYKCTNSIGDSLHESNYVY